MNRWDGLDEFVAVAECGSFSRAAESLRVSSSHVSRQVASLEERLQARLLYRTTRRVSLTEAGQTFFAKCQRLIEERDEAFLTMGDLQSAPTGLLRMTAAVAYGERFIVPLVNEFMAQYPILKVDIELTNRAVDMVHEGFDLAIRLSRLNESSLVATRIAPRANTLFNSLCKHTTDRGAPIQCSGSKQFIRRCSCREPTQHEQTTRVARKVHATCITPFFV